MPLFIAAWFSQGLLLAQPQPDSLWTRVTGSAGNDHSWGIAAVTDGAVVAGVLSMGQATMEAYAVKLNSSGDTVWTVRLPGGLFSSIRSTADHGFILSGWLITQGPDSDEAILVRLNAAGDTLWTHTYGGSHLDRGKDALELADGGFLLAGYTESSSADQNRDGFILRTTARGDTVWTKVLGGSWEDTFSRMTETREGDFLVWGSTGPSTKGPFSPWIVRMDGDGRLAWTQSYVLGNKVGLGGIVPQEDGRFLAVGTLDWTTCAESQMIIVQFTAEGDTVWTRRLGGAVTGGLQGYDVVAGRTGWVAAGTRYDPGTTTSHMLLMGLSATGDSLWSKSYGEKALATRVQKTADGGYLLSGVQAAGPYGRADILVVKTGPEAHGQRNSSR
jgi:hypothetical protein